VHDIGEEIGGAHMTLLKRIRAGIFFEKDCHIFEEINEAFKLYKKGDESLLRNLLIPGEIISQIFPIINVKEEYINQLLNGKPILKNDIIGNIPDSKMISVFSKDTFIGVYVSVDNNNILFRPDFVFN
jgi:tRNA U55 pseudouridine synthase TruB